MKHNNSNSSTRTEAKEEEEEVGDPRVATGRDSTMTTTTGQSRHGEADRMCSPKAAAAAAGDVGGGTVVTVNGCPPKSSSVIYLSADSCPPGRSGHSGIL
jgi:hypothetical protein